MLEFQDSFSTVSGSIIGGLFVLGVLLSKFSVLWKRDRADAAVSQAQTTVVEMLRSENTRLHNQVQQLQQEVAKLQLLVTELTSKLIQFEIRSEQQKHIDTLAKMGKVDRRNRKDNEEFYPVTEQDAESIAEGVLSTFKEIHKEEKD